jgi:hypothetical protein
VPLAQGRTPLRGGCGHVSCLSVIGLTGRVAFGSRLAPLDSGPTTARQEVADQCPGGIPALSDAAYVADDSAFTSEPRCRTCRNQRL